MDIDSALEARILAAVDEQELIATAQALVRIPSVTGDEAEAQRHFAGMLAGAGLDVDLWPLDLPALRSDPVYPGEEAARTEGWGLAARWGSGDGPCLVLNGHMDVVPAGSRDHWSTDPWGAEIRAGRLYGRGACDMKAGLAAAVGAIRALQRAGVHLAGSVLLQSVVGEEDGGLGTLATIRRGQVGDAAVIMEPTNLTLIPAQAGALTFLLQVPGLSAHACVRLEGVSAVEKFVPLLQALQRLEVRRNAAVEHPLLRRYPLPYALNIGIVHAGNWSASVPESLEAYCRYGVAVGEDVGAARQMLEDAIAAAAEADPWLRTHPPRVTWVGGQFASGETPQDHPLIRLLGSCVEAVRGTLPRIDGAPYGSDLRLLVNEARIPSVLFGPGDVRVAHMPDEHVEIGQVLDTARALALLIVRFCGVASIT